MRLNRVVELAETALSRGLGISRDGGPKMPVIGYARVSTTDQNLDLQQTALQAAGCEIIRSEKRSGTTTAGRGRLRTVLDFLRKGDSFGRSPA